MNKNGTIIYLNKKLFEGEIIRVRIYLDKDLIEFG